jgi:SAM-dependent methyltransferase
MTISKTIPEGLAKEFYDPALHPTTANFRALSLDLLGQALPHLCARSTVIEIGAARSIFLDIPSIRPVELPVICLDHSTHMIRHSRQPNQGNLILAIGDAEALPIQASTVDVLVASLGAPYNTLEFWREARRVLKPDARLYFTTPSFEWASVMRPTTAGTGLTESASYSVRNSTIELLSITYAEEEQIALLAVAGITVVRVLRAPLSWIKQQDRASAVTMLDENSTVVTGYCCRPALSKRHQSCQPHH